MTDPIVPPVTVPVVEPTDVLSPNTVPVNKLVFLGLLMMVGALAFLAYQLSREKPRVIGVPAESHTANGNGVTVPVDAPANPDSEVTA